MAAAYSIFKLTYANNEVISCKIADANIVLDGLYHYEHKNGKMIYAFIKASNEEQAIAVSHTIVFDLKLKYSDQII